MDTYGNEFYDKINAMQVALGVSDEILDQAADIMRFVLSGKLPRAKFVSEMESGGIANILAAKIGEYCVKNIFPIDDKVVDPVAPF